MQFLYNKSVGMYLICQDSQQFSMNGTIILNNPSDQTRMKSREADQILWSQKQSSGYFFCRTNPPPTGSHNQSIHSFGISDECAYVTLPAIHFSSARLIVENMFVNLWIYVVHHSLYLFCRVLRLACFSIRSSCTIGTEEGTLSPSCGLVSGLGSNTGP